MSEILHEEIKIKGIYLGSSVDDNSDPVAQNMISKSYIVFQSLTPEWMGKKLDVQFLDVVKKYRSKSKSMAKQPPFFEELKGVGYGQDFIDIYNSSDVFKAEIPSANFRDHP